MQADALSDEGSPARAERRPHPAIAGVRSAAIRSGGEGAEHDGPLLKQDALDARRTPCLGEVFLQNGDAKKAEEYFIKSSKLDPGNERRAPAGPDPLGGGRDEAGPELQQIAGSETGNTATLALISARLRRGEFDKALAAIDILDKKPPARPWPPTCAAGPSGEEGCSGARKAFGAVSFD